MKRKSTLYVIAIVLLILLLNACEKEQVTTELWKTGLWETEQIGSMTFTAENKKVLILEKEEFNSLLIEKDTEISIIKEESNLLESKEKKLNLEIQKLKYEINSMSNVIESIYIDEVTYIFKTINNDTTKIYANSNCLYEQKKAYGEVVEIHFDESNYIIYIVENRINNILYLTTINYNPNDQTYIYKEKELLYNTYYVGVDNDNNFYTYSFGGDYLELHYYNNESNAFIKKDYSFKEKQNLGIANYEIDNKKYFVDYFDSLFICENGETKEIVRSDEYIYKNTTISEDRKNVVFTAYLDYDFLEFKLGIYNIENESISYMDGRFSEYQLMDLSFKDNETVILEYHLNPSTSLYEVINILTGEINMFSTEDYDRGDKVHTSYNPHFMEKFYPDSLILNHDTIYEADNLMVNIYEVLSNTDSNLVTFIEEENYIKTLVVGYINDRTKLLENILRFDISEYPNNVYLSKDDEIYLNHTGEVYKLNKEKMIFEEAYIHFEYNEFLHNLPKDEVVLEHYFKDIYFAELFLEFRVYELK